MRRLLPATMFVAVGAVLAAGCGGSSDSSSGGDTTTGSGATVSAGISEAKLSGSVGPGFEISMVEKSVAPGTYTLTVNDQADVHNFHLTGPGGVDVKTDVAGTGTKTFTVDLQAGTYTFVCDPHSSSMSGTLTVG